MTTTDPPLPTTASVNTWRWLDITETRARLNQDGVAFGRGPRRTNPSPTDKALASVRVTFKAFATDHPVPTVWYRPPARIMA